MRTVALVGFDGMRLFDVTVALEVWGVDRTSVGVPGFELRVCTSGRRPVKTDFGLVTSPTHGLSGLVDADLVVVPGAADLEGPLPPAVFTALRSAHQTGATLAALCSGAVILARAGLLDHRRATTHWMHVAHLAENYPHVLVENDRLFVQDGAVWTSAGAAAGLDMCLHLVRLAHGAVPAAAIAKRMVTPPHRIGSQRQFIDHLHPGRADTKDAVAMTMDWARHHLDQPLTIGALARHAKMSERTLARRFATACGTSVAAWLAHERLLLAQQLLETTTLPVASIATQAGFGTPLTLRRHFLNQLKITPARYRSEFTQNHLLEPSSIPGTRPAVNDHPT
jgi:transcriptional regulator GlxA family with amidase domain